MSDPQSQATALFAKSFGSLEGATTVFAPGRVNLIGEHTDYNGGHVMPLALGFRTVIVGRRTAGAACTVASANVAGGAAVSFSGDASLAPEAQSSATRWTNYVKGVVAEYVADCGGAVGFEAAIASDVPMGAGLSSSASLEVAVATLIEALYALQLDADPQQAKIKKALRCQACEHKFCYTNCGIMDQFISAVGRQGHALLIDCRANAPTLVPLDNPDVVLLVANTLATHSLGGEDGESWYNKRVADCGAAVAAMHKRKSKGGGSGSPADAAKLTLRDFSAEELEAVKADIEPRQHARARHAIEENDRCVAAQRALTAGDYDTVGALMNASHESLRDRYEVSCAELDELQRLAVGVDGVYGSRMTGAGYGGCTVTMLKKSAVEQLKATLAKEYYAKHGLTPTMFVTVADAGAGLLPTASSSSSSSSSAPPSAPLPAVVQFSLVVALACAAKHLGM
jgi:galactokinase